MAEQENLIVRAFELPVQHVEAEGRDGWALVRECWREATDLANWGVQQLLRHDVVRLPGMKRLPPYPRVNGPRHRGLYGLAADTLGLKDGFWKGACISASTVLRAVEAKYLRERLDVAWRRVRQPCTYKYPHPWPVHAQGWLAAGEEGGRPLVRLALPGGHVALRLRGGPEFGRQVALFRRVAEGGLPRLQLVIRQQGASPGCHRPTVRDRGAACRVMLKMVAKLPAAPAPGARVLTLTTDPGAFWVAELDGRRAWVLNNDHVKRAFDWLAAWDARRHRLSQDRKAERRLDPDAIASIDRAQRRAADKHRRRTHSWLHETAAHLAGFCARQRVGTVLYLDGCRDFIPHFPWHQLRQLLGDKLAAAGVALVSEAGGAAGGVA